MSWWVFLWLLITCWFYNLQTVALFLLSSYYTLLKDASYVAVIALLLYVGCYQVLSPLCTIAILPCLRTPTRIIVTSVSGGIIISEIGVEWIALHQRFSSWLLPQICEFICDNLSDKENFLCSSHLVLLAGLWSQRFSRLGCEGVD